MALKKICCNYFNAKPQFDWTMIQHAVFAAWNPQLNDYNIYGRISTFQFQMKLTNDKNRL